MTSRRKIMAIAKAAKQHSCSVMLKTGKPPGVMMAEGDDEAQVKQWVQGVKVTRLGGKGYEVEIQRLPVAAIASSPGCAIARGARKCPRVRVDEGSRRLSGSMRSLAMVDRAHGFHPPEGV
ncbi:MAG: hypothetical protein Q9173_000852 [Seirophora scorigena]